jgi:hypothetical protein
MGKKKEASPEAKPEVKEQPEVIEDSDRDAIYANFEKQEYAQKESTADSPEEELTGEEAGLSPEKGRLPRSGENRG